MGFDRLRRHRAVVILLALAVLPFACAQSERRERRMPTERQERPGKYDPPRGGRDSLGLVPLTELGTGTYKGQTGGLYGEGRNEPPPAHAAAARRQLELVQPLDRAGRPSGDGKIILLSIGMSNTHAEFVALQKLAARDPLKDPRVVLVDGAQGGNDAAHWAANRVSPRTGRPLWTRVGEKLSTAGGTAPQVQVAWIKLVVAFPADHGEFPEHALVLKREITGVLHLLKDRYPNTRIAYLSSRVYAGYSQSPLSPEPHAYETAFTVRWLIEEQIRGAPELNYDPAEGPVRAPLLLWGPYMWADGQRPRGDGLSWEREDFNRDGVHPSEDGLSKVAGLLLDFFRNDPFTRSWYRGDRRD